MQSKPKKLSGVIKCGDFMEILKLMEVYSWENHGSTAGKFIAGPRVFFGLGWTLIRIVACH
jgi:hypothetical protein